MNMNSTSMVEPNCKVVDPLVTYRPELELTHPLAGDPGVAATRFWPWVLKVVASQRVPH